MGIEIVIAFILIISTALWYKIFDRASMNRKKLPGPINFPFVGAALQIALNGNKRNYEIIEDLAKAYGPLFGFQAGINYFVLVQDAKLAKEIMSSNEYTARVPDSKFIFERSFNQNLGLLFSHGESWKEIRRYTLRTLRQYGFGKGATMESSLETEITNFVDHFETLRNKTNNVIHVNQLFHVAMLNITWTMISGMRFSNDDETFRAFLHTMDDMLKAHKPGISVMSAYPFLRYIPRLTEHDQMISVHKKLQELFKEALDERRLRGHYLKNQEDFLDSFLKDVDDPQTSNPIQHLLTEEQLLMVCIDLFFTSSDTTSSSLEFALLYMIHNPSVMFKVQNEIDSVIGCNRLPSLDDRNKMPYLEATMLEVLRYSSINPLAGRSSTTNDTYIDGYFIPKKSVVGIMLHAIHFDEKTWGDPLTFRPERFLNDKLEIVNKEKIMAFGHGTRICIGENLAKASFFIFFVTLMQRYDIKKSPHHENPTIEPRTGMTSTPQPFFVVAERRR